MAGEFDKFGERPGIAIRRSLENDPLGFNALTEEVDGISAKVQTDVLEKPEKHGFADRAVVNETPVRVEYTLTDRGRSLERPSSLCVIGAENISPLQKTSERLF